MDTIYCILYSAEGVIRQVCVQNIRRLLYTATVSNKLLVRGRTYSQYCRNRQEIALCEFNLRETWW
jgi:hypothetical protein